MVVLTEKGVRDALWGLEEKHPDFKDLYDDDSICSCCKVDYDLWSFEKVNDWRSYTSRRFLLGE